MLKTVQAPTRVAPHGPTIMYEASANELPIPRTTAVGVTTVVRDSSTTYMRPRISADETANSL